MENLRRLKPLPRAGVPPYLSDGMLVSAAKSGEEWAFAELCSRHSKRILFKIYRITKCWDDAEDVLQEAILKALLHLKDFNQAAAFSTWLTQISINSALTLLRRKRVRQEVSLEMESDQGNEVFEWEIADRRTGPEDYYIQCESYGCLSEAISRLPSAYRIVVEFHQQSDGPLEETARHVGITIAATKARMVRATKMLREVMTAPRNRRRTAGPLYRDLRT